jgi:hypothetical protein
MSAAAGLGQSNKARALDGATRRQVQEGRAKHWTGGKQAHVHQGRQLHAAGHQSADCDKWSIHKAGLLPAINTYLSRITAAHCSADTNLSLS